MESNKIKNQINVCKTYICTLNDKIYSHSEILKWFTELCSVLSKVINLIAEENKQIVEKINKIYKDNLLLYLTQLLTSLSLLINVFVKESEITHSLTEGRNCAKKQIILCLDGIEESILKNKFSLDPSGSFIKWMDEALDKIVEIDMKEGKTACLKIFNDAKVLFEEVLCHAMSIAQVALPEDCKIIKGSSQTVLNALDSLFEEIQKAPTNLAMVNLFIDACSDKLCILERRVNTAVLKLTLQVFSNYLKSLTLIKQFCLNKTNKGNAEQLDGLVADFDLHVDRIMQIGLFAVSCSTCTNRVIKIRSCLASLEGLESELVPAFTSVLLDHSSHNVNYAELLEKHWIQQAHILQKFTFLIIDPFAFCQVVHEENKQIVESLSDTIKINKEPLKKHLIQSLIDNTIVLKDFMNVSMKELTDEEFDIKKVEDTFKDLTNVLHEVQVASNILLQGYNIENNLRMLKRCKILVMTIKKLYHCLAEDYNVENENIEVEEKSSVKPDQPTGNVFLDHIINRGKQILKDRSILYKNSLKNDSNHLKYSTTKQIKKIDKNVPLSKLVHLRKIRFMNSMVKNESSVDLQITDILNELTNMSNTFKK